MTDLLRAAYRRALRTGATVYGWTTYYRLALADLAPDAASCMGECVAVQPSGAVERYTYDPTVQLADGEYGAWRLTGRATLDRAGSVISAEDVTP